MVPTVLNYEYTYYQDSLEFDIYVVEYLINIRMSAYYNIMIRLCNIHTIKSFNTSQQFDFGSHFMINATDNILNNCLINTTYGKIINLS